MKLSYEVEFCKVRIKKGYSYARLSNLDHIYNKRYGLLMDVRSDYTGSYVVPCKCFRSFRRFLRKQSCVSPSNTEFRLLKYKDNRLTTVVIGKTR